MCILVKDNANRLDKLVQHSQSLKLVIGYSELTTPSVSALGDACATSDIYHLQSSASDYTWPTFCMRPHLLLMLTCTGQTYVGICIFLVKRENQELIMTFFTSLCTPGEPSNTASHYLVIVMTSGTTIPMVHYQLLHNSDTESNNYASHETMQHSLCLIYTH